MNFGRIRPATLGQAGRISGITPADVAVLAVWPEKVEPGLRIDGSGKQGGGLKNHRSHQSWRISPIAALAFTLPLDASLGSPVPWVAVVEVQGSGRGHCLGLLRRRYFVSHGNGWIYLGVGETDSPGEGWAPWRWDTSIKGEHHRWFPPMDFLQKKSDYQFGICYWLLLVGHVVLWAGAAILWERRKRRVMDCQMLLSDDTSEASP